MKCLRQDCDADRSEAGECPGCRLPIYCSAECCERDRREHKPYCRTTFTIEDFAEVKQNKRTQILGRGAFGEVKLVVHKATSTYFALKTVEKDRAAEQIAVLRREISLHRQLIHPNIVRLYACFEDLENVYLLLEFADNGNLYSAVRKSKGLPEETARTYFVQVCRGVQHLHDKLLVHRDIKPENILLTKHDELKICDFGWCAEGLDIRDTFCGTIDYMAPEMILGEGHSFSIDMWALGVLLYEMVHGRAPWSASKDTDKTEQILSVQYSCADSINPLIVDLISQLLQKDPNARLSISQVFMHPWMQQRDNLPVHIGDTVSYYLKGFGMSEAIVTEINEDNCTLFFEANRSYQQVKMGKLLALKKQQEEEKAEEQSESSSVAAKEKPESLRKNNSAESNQLHLPPQLQLEDEAEILAKIDAWCKQPSKIPIKETSLLRELDESKRRLDMSLAELMEKGSDSSRTPSVFAPESPAPVHHVNPLKLPSFLQDLDQEPASNSKLQTEKQKVLPKPPVKAIERPENLSPSSSEIKRDVKAEEPLYESEEEEEPADPLPVPRRWQKSNTAVNKYLLKTRERELEQRLAKHQEELRKIAEELEKPSLPKVKTKKEEKGGVLAWFGGLFK